MKQINKFKINVSKLPSHNIIRNNIINLYFKYIEYPYNSYQINDITLSKLDNETSETLKKYKNNNKIYTYKQINRLIKRLNINIDINFLQLNVDAYYFDNIIIRQIFNLQSFYSPTQIEYIIKSLKIRENNGLIGQEIFQEFETKKLNKTIKILTYISVIISFIVLIFSII